MEGKEIFQVPAHKFQDSASFIWVLSYNNPDLCTQAGMRWNNMFILKIILQSYYLNMDKGKTP
jgi:hypothetical protein